MPISPMPILPMPILPMPTCQSDSEAAPEKMPEA